MQHKEQRDHEERSRSQSRILKINLIHLLKVGNKNHQQKITIMLLILLQYPDGNRAMGGKTLGEPPSALCQAQLTPTPTSGPQLPSHALLGTS